MELLEAIQKDITSLVKKSNFELKDGFFAERKG